MVDKSIDHRNDVIVAQFVLSGFPHERYFPRIMSTEMDVKKLSVLDKKRIDNNFHGLSFIDHRNDVKMFHSMFILQTFWQSKP